MDVANNSRRVREELEKDNTCTVGELEDLVFLSETGPTSVGAAPIKPFEECAKELEETKAFPTRLQTFTTHYTTFVRDHLKLQGTALETAVQKGVAAFIAPAHSMRAHRLGAALAKELARTASDYPDNFFQREQSVEQFYRTFYANEGATGGVLEALVLITNVNRLEERKVHNANSYFMEKVISLQSDAQVCTKFLIGEGYSIATTNLLDLWSEKPFKSLKELLDSGLLFSAEAPSIIQMKAAIEESFADRRTREIVNTPLTA